MRVADAGFYVGRVEETTKNRESYWRRWNVMYRPMGVDPCLTSLNGVGCRSKLILSL